MGGIKVIAVDLGGVLFSEGKKVAFSNLAKKYNYDEKIILPLISARLSQIANDTRKGLVDEEVFWEWVQNNLPVGYDAKLIRQEWWDGYVLDPEIFSVFKKVKSLGSVKLIIFSGNFSSRVAYLEEKYHFESIFDEKIYSFNEHLNKTGNCKQFLEALIKKSGVKAGEILYLDDGEDFIEEANKLGMRGKVCNAGEMKRLANYLEEFGIN